MCIKAITVDSIETSCGFTSFKCCTDTAIVYKRSFSVNIRRLTVGYIRIGCIRNVKRHIFCLNTGEVKGNASVSIGEKGCTKTCSYRICCSNSLWSAEI